MFKAVVVCAVIAVGLLGVIHASDLILGNIQAGDRILHNQGYVGAGILNQIASRVVSYNGVYNITAIRAYDRSFNRTGAATLTYGGLGYKNASILVQGRSLGYGYDYLVEIYGR